VKAGSGRRVVVTGSVAFDYLMTFGERFLDVLVPDRMHRLSVSFRVDAMRRVRGGCAPNIAYSLARLGARPVIMATAGSDAREYRDWLGEAGVDVSLLKLHDDLFTASFFVTTDRDQNQLGTFYSGAMDRARDLSFRDVDPRTVDMAVIAPNDPEAMARYARECRDLGISFVYDPSQQVAQLTGDELLAGVEGATIFIGNEYEFGVIEKKTGLAESELLARVPVLIITRGGEGSTIALRGGTQENPDGARTIRVPPAEVEATELDPTGVGDAYRAGLLAARLAGLPWEVAGRVGSIAAVYALETIGPQPLPYSMAEFRARYEANFGSGDGPALGRLEA
jgi:adenosine kinase